MIKNIFKKSVKEIKVPTMQKMDAKQLSKVIGGTDDSSSIPDETSRVVNKGQIKGNISVSSGN